MLAPTTAWAHGDHEGLHGFVHVLTEPLHLGGFLIVGLAALTLGRQLRRLWQTKAERQEAERKCTD